MACCVPITQLAGEVSLGAVGGQAEELRVCFEVAIAVCRDSIVGNLGVVELEGPQHEMASIKAGHMPPP